MSSTAQSSRFSPRFLRWLLIGSLALNVLVIGTVASALCIARFGGPHPGGAFKGGVPLIGFARVLPRERADIVRQKLADAEPKLEAARRGIRDARAAVRDALSGEGFDQAKFSAALDGLVSAETNEARAKTARFSEVVGALSAEERRQLHEWLDSRRPIR